MVGNFKKTDQFWDMKYFFPYFHELKFSVLTFCNFLKKSWKKANFCFFVYLFICFRKAVISYWVAVGTWFLGCSEWLKLTKKQFDWICQYNIKVITIIRYINADLKICQYLCLHMKILCWRFHIKTPFAFWIMRT